jgi:hypothetical protein
MAPVGARVAAFHLGLRERPAEAMLAAALDGTVRTGLDTSLPARLA